MHSRGTEVVVRRTYSCSSILLLLLLALSLALSITELL